MFGAMFNDHEMGARNGWVECFARLGQRKNVVGVVVVVVVDAGRLWSLFSARV